MNTAFGRHFLVELVDCSEKILNNQSEIVSAMVSAANASGMHIVEECFHKFSPHGVSGVLVIAESHIAIHTWPEYLYAAVDVFTCGSEGSPEKASEFLIKAFGAKSAHVIELERGPHLPVIVNMETTHPPG